MDLDCILLGIQLDIEKGLTEVTARKKDKMDQNK